MARTVIHRPIAGANPHLRPGQGWWNPTGVVLRGHGRGHPLPSHPRIRAVGACHQVAGVTSQSSRSPALRRDPLRGGDCACSPDRVLSKFLGENAGSAGRPPRSGVGRPFCRKATHGLAPGGVASMACHVAAVPPRTAGFVHVFSAHLLGRRFRPSYSCLRQFVPVRRTGSRRCGQNTEPASGPDRRIN